MSTTLHSFIDIFGSEFTEGGTTVQLNKIIIPIIQRDYAQGRRDPEVDRVRIRFLKALHEAVTEKPITLDFVYGDIDENGVMTPLDGQQRLTTLFLLHWYAAKKCGIEKSEYSFLENFSYETRYSARYFCKELVRFTPSFEGVLREEIINQPWFPLDWKKDPTISSMLVMLNDIDEQFNDVPELWEQLKNKSITFYFLPIKDMGLTDELYIKMNSRGKPLTLFEHFKAELEKEMTAVDADAARRIIAKFDREWMDLLWRYRNGNKGTSDDNTTDDEFLNYFRFICDVICYKKGESPQGRNSDEFELIQRYFTGQSESALDNMQALEKAFDCWCHIPGYDSPTAFLNEFMSAEHEVGKIKVDSRYRDRIDIFEDCLHSYSEVSGRLRMFPLNRFVMLFAVICYLQHMNIISEDEFRTRLRIINNLLQNSEDEVSDRIDRNRIPAVLEQTESIILNGEINDSIENHYNVGQVQEEREKMAFVAVHPEKKEVLSALEDNPMLHGQISIIGLDHIDYSDRFASLFKCNWDMIDCALMATGDYGQMERNRWRYQYGSSGRLYAWDELFHKSRNSGFENTSRILIELLSRYEIFDDEKLETVASEYITKCEDESTFPWRYYYIKYPAFRPGSFGKLGMIPDHYEQYMFAVLQTKSQFSENTYIPYLMEADPGHINRDSKGQRLSYLENHIICNNSAFIVRNNVNDEIVDTIEISQNDDGVDTENRVEKLRSYIQTHSL